MNAETIANGLSEGIDSLWSLVAALDGTCELSTPAGLARALTELEGALTAIEASATLWPSFRPGAEDLPRVRKLRQLVAAWEEAGTLSPDLLPLAHEMLQSASAWR